MTHVSRTGNIRGNMTHDLPSCCGRFRCCAGGDPCGLIETIAGSDVVHGFEDVGRVNDVNGSDVPNG